MMEVWYVSYGSNISEKPFPVILKEAFLNARKYLITDEQFGEVVEQENNVDALNINLMYTISWIRAILT